MKPALEASLCILITALLCGACANFGKPAPKVDYYTLEYVPPARDDAPIQMPVCIKIRRFKVSPLYNSNKIIYRDKAFARNEYHFHKWRANPGDIIAYFLKRDLQQSSLFKAVFGHEEEVSCDYLLEGTVDEFLELDHPDSWQAVLCITVALIKAGEADVGKRFIFQKTYRAQTPCRQKNPKSLAEAMSLAMAQVSEQVTDDVVHALQAPHSNIKHDVGRLLISRVCKLQAAAF